MAERGEAVGSAGAEFDSEDIFIDTARLKEALAEDETSSDKDGKPNTETSVTVEYSEPLVQPSSNALSQLEPSFQPNTSSKSADNPTSLEVQFTPSEAGSREENVCVSSSSVAQSSQLTTPSQEKGEKTTDRDVRDSAGVGETKHGVLYQITSSSGVVSDSAQQQVTQVSASNTAGESEHSTTSSRTVGDNVTQSLPEHETNVSEISRTIEESEQHQIPTQVSSSGTVSESENLQSDSRNLSPAHPNPSSNVEVTSSHRPNTSSPIATPTAMPTRGGATAAATSSESQSPTLGVSPYVMVKGGGGGGVRGLMEMPQFESPGLLYAKSTKERHNLDMLKPADEVAEDVLEMIEDDPSHQLSWMEEEEVDGDWEGEGGGGDTAHPLHLKDDSSTSLESPDEPRPLSPVDPNALRDLELQAKKVGSSLDYIMENLHNSLHAMTVCAKQSVMLHRESVNKLHSVVDTNVKATYSFLAKFEELKRQTVPLHTLSHQIKDINKILKVLERNFRTP